MTIIKKSPYRFGIWGLSACNIIEGHDCSCNCSYVWAELMNTMISKGQTNGKSTRIWLRRCPPLPQRRGDPRGAACRLPGVLEEAAGAADVEPLPVAAHAELSKDWVGISRQQPQCQAEEGCPPPHRAPPPASASPRRAAACQPRRCMRSGPNQALIDNCNPISHPSS